MRNEINKEQKGAKALLAAIAVLLGIQIFGVIYNSKDTFNEDINLKNSFAKEYDDSEIDELIIKEKITNSVNSLFELDRYIELSEKLNSMGVLKKIEVDQSEIDQSVLLTPDQIDNLIELLNDKDKKDEVREMLIIEEALINEHIYNFAYNEAPKIAEVVTKAQILDTTYMSENEDSRLVTTSYESVCLNHDFTKKIAYVTGTATFAASSNSDLGKFVILSLNLGEHEPSNENKQIYNKDLNKDMKKYIKYLNRVINNEYEIKDIYGGHVKKLVKSK